LVYPFSVDGVGGVTKTAIALLACLIVGFNVAMIRHIDFFVKLHSDSDRLYWRMLLIGKTGIALFLAFDLLTEAEVIPVEIAFAGVGVTITFLALALLTFRKDRHR
jgi:hypothetical protein